MTVKAVAWALDDAPVENAQQALILVALAERSRDGGRNCWMSHASIAARARCSVSTVQRHLSELEAAGLIRRGDQAAVPVGIPANRRPVVWDLMLDRTRGVLPVDDDPEPVDNQGDALAGQNDWSVKSEGLAGQNQPLGRSLVTDKPNTNQEINRRATRGSRDLSTQGFPPSPTALRAAELAACEHGAPPGRCALCRRAGHDD